MEAWRKRLRLLARHRIDNKAYNLLTILRHIGEMELEIRRLAMGGANRVVFVAIVAHHLGVRFQSFALLFATRSCTLCFSAAFDGIRGPRTLSYAAKSDGCSN